MRNAFVDAWGLALSLHWDLVWAPGVNWLLLYVHSFLTFSIVDSQLLESQVPIVELVLQYDRRVKRNLHSQKLKRSVRHQLENQTLWQVIWNLHCKSPVRSRWWPNGPWNVRLRIDVLENNARSERDYCVLFAIDSQIELRLLWLGSSLEDGDVRCFLIAFIFDFCLVQLVVDLEISSGEDLEDSVTVVFKVQDIVVGFILGFDISETLGCEKTKVVVFLLVPLNQYALTKTQMRVSIWFWHEDIIVCNKLLNESINRSTVHY